MRSVRKFVLVDHEVTVSMPYEAKILTAHKNTYDNWPAVWIEARWDEPHISKLAEFRTVATGDTVPDEYEYVGTSFNGVFAWHVYQRIVV